ncbi:MAG: hypothetical protein MUE34_01850 [Acidimicrobiales bacterium]|jgi:hypothetical protein|nr:hypothetical protein [Acidimicrobiales bacterium]
MTDPETHPVAEAVAGYATAVRDGWDELIAPRQPLAPVDLADGSRFLAALAEGALTFVHADPAAPLVVPWTTPDRRWADNGADSAYWFIPVDGRHRYRISGTRHDECYLSFTLYAGSPGHPERVVRNVNHLGLGAGEGDDYELELDPPEDACYVIARQYFLDPAVSIPASIHVEVLGGPVAEPAGSEVLAARWDTAAAFVRTMTRPPTAAGAPSYAAAEPNRIGAPAGWRQEEGGGRGTPDQTYALGRYRVEPDEALVMELRLPRCTYASVVLWNRFGQSIDTRAHRSVLNHCGMVADADGVVRVVVAHRDPGVPNWLDAGGRTQGTVFWRFLLAEEQPGPVDTRLVPLSALS